MLFNVLAFCTMMIVATMAGEGAVEYVNDGAVLFQTGTVELNNPDPIKIAIEDFTRCTGKILLCYKALDKGRPAYDGCKAGFCNFQVDVSDQKSLVASRTITGNTLKFTLDDSLAGYCAPDTTNGIYTYDIKTLPTQCTVKVIGATDPAIDEGTTITTDLAVMEAETPTSTISTAVIWGIGAGGVFAVLIAVVIIGIIIYKCVIHPRRVQRANRRRSQSRSTGPPASQPLLPTTQTSTTVASKESSGQPPVEKPQVVEPPAPSVESAPVTPPPAPPVEKKKLTPEERQLQLVPLTDTVLCTFQRLDHIDPEIQREVAEHWNIHVIHDVSKLEKTILHAPADAALEALNQLTAELDIGLLKNKAKYGRNETTDEVWEYANFIGIPASAGYRLLAMSYPDIFKGMEERLDDPVIAKLSIPGLYVCLMYDGFDQIFKKKLIIEIRARAVKLLENASAKELYCTAFPIYYLATRYKLDKKHFIEGSNVEDAKKSSRRSRRSRRSSVRE